MVVGGVREECMGWAACEGGGVAQCISRYRKKEKKKKKKRKKKHTFSFHFWVSWAQFLMIVTSIDLLGDAQVICLAWEHVWGCFLVTWRWGVETYQECVCTLWGGSSLKKKAVSCRYRSVMKD
jgi:hypothetical protein